MREAFAIYAGEFRRMVGYKPAFSVLFLAPFIYALFYPQPYLNEALRKIPIAIVDLDNTLGSRELMRNIDATSDVAVASSFLDLPSAQREVFARRIFGILVIPANFERDLLHGRSAPVALYADASYFLIYQRITGGVTAVTRTFGAQVEAHRLVAGGVDPALAAAATDPMPLTAVALFNPQAGYATYLLPAAFVLIIQQTLLIGVALLGTVSVWGRSPTNAPSRASPALVILSREMAYLSLGLIVVLIYLIVLPYLYGLPRLGNLLNILIFAVPFLLAVFGLGMVLSAVFRTQRAVQLACAAIGLPFFFLAGFAWPFEAIPPAIRALAQAVPSTSAIEGFVALGPLGASLSDVRQDFWTLWTLAVIYSAVAILLEARRRRKMVLAYG